MSTMDQSPLVSVDWLIGYEPKPQLVVLDASWYLPELNRNGFQEWLKERIPGSGFFDFDGRIKDHASSLPRMLPNEAVFSEAVRELGVNKDSMIVIYDSNNLFSAPRAWWMFRAMGHQKVAILDGGLQAWKNAGQVTESGQPEKKAWGDFTAKLTPGIFVDTQAVKEGLDVSNTLVCDARSQERFNAAHMPNAVNLPYTKLLENGRMKSCEDLKMLFESVGITNQKLIFSCGSGVTACILALGAQLANFTNVSVYDGSWAQWEQLQLPIASG